MARGRPPASTPLALRTDCKLSIPIDLERAQIVAAFDVIARIVLFHRTDKFNAMILSAIEHDLTSYIGTVHKLALRQELSSCELVLAYGRCGQRPEPARSVSTLMIKCGTSGEQTSVM